MAKFQKILDKEFGVKMSDREVWLLTHTFPGRRGALGEDRISIVKMNDVQFAEGVNKVYKNTKLPETDNDEAGD